MYIEVLIFHKRNDSQQSHCCERTTWFPTITNSLHSWCKCAVFLEKTYNNFPLTPVRVSIPSAHFDHL
jgi:hypothetical protein